MTKSYTMSLDVNPAVKGLDPLVTRLTEVQNMVDQVNKAMASASRIQSSSGSNSTGPTSNGTDRYTAALTKQKMAYAQVNQAAKAQQDTIRAAALEARRLSAEQQTAASRQMQSLRQQQAQESLLSQQRVAASRERVQLAREAEQQEQAAANRALNAERLKRQQVMTTAAEQQAASREANSNASTYNRLITESYRAQKQASMDYYAAVESAQSKVIGSMLAGQALNQTSTAVKQWAADIIDTAGDVQQQLASMSVTVQAPNYDKLNEQITNVGANLATTMDTTSEIATNLGQANVPADKLAESTEAVSKFVQTTDVAGAGAANSLARVYDLTKDDVGSMEDLANAQYVASNASTATADEVLNMTTALAPMHQQFGIATGDLIGMGSEMASLGVSSSKMSSSMQRVFSKMANIAANGGEKLQTMASIAGTTAEQFQKMLKDNPMEAYMDFAKGLNTESGGDMTKFYTTMKALGISATYDATTLQLVGSNTDSLSKSMRNANTALGTHADLNDAVNKKTDTLQASVQKLNNTWDAMVYQSTNLHLLTAPLNAVQKGMDALNKSADGGDILSKVAQYAVTATVGIAELAGSVGQGVSKFYMMKSVMTSVQLQYAQLAAATGEYHKQVLGLNDDMQRSALSMLEQKAQEKQLESTFSALKEGADAKQLSGITAGLSDLDDEGLTKSLKSAQEQIRNIRTDITGAATEQGMVVVAAEGLTSATKATGDAQQSNISRNETLKAQMIEMQTLEARTAAIQAEQAKRQTAKAGSTGVVSSLTAEGAGVKSIGSGLAANASKLLTWFGAISVGVGIVGALVGAYGTWKKSQDDIDDRITHSKEAFAKANEASVDYSDTISQGQTEYQKTGSAIEVMRTAVKNSGGDFSDAASDADDYTAAVTSAYTASMNKKLASDIFSAKPKNGNDTDDTFAQIIQKTKETQDASSGLSRTMDDLIAQLNSNALSDGAKKDLDAISALGSGVEKVKEASKKSFAFKIDDLSKMSLDELVKEQKKLSGMASGMLNSGNAGSVQVGQAYQQQADAMSTLIAEADKLGVSGKTTVGTMESIASAAEGASSKITAMSSQMDAAQSVMNATSKAADMSDIASNAKDIADSTKQIGSLSSAFDSVADAGYKASNGLADFSDANKVAETTTQAVSDVLDQFKDSPADAAAGLVQLGDTLQAVGVKGGSSLDYVRNTLLQVASQMNQTYGMSIDTSNANANVNALKANIMSAISALSATSKFQDAMKSTGDSTPYFRQVIQLHSAQEAMALSEVTAKQRATQATKDNTKATKDNSDAQKENARTINDVVSDFQKLLGWYNQFKFGVMDARIQLQSQFDSIDKSLQKTVEFVDKVSDTIDKLFGRSNAKDALLTQINSLTKKIQDARDKYAELQATMSDQRAEESQLKYWLKQAQAIGDVARAQQIQAQLEQNAASQKSTKNEMNEAQQTLNPTATGDGDTAIESRKNLQDLATSYMEYGAALKKSGASDAEVAAQMSRMQGEFESFGKSLGYTKEELEPYVNALKGTLYTMDSTSDSAKSAEEQILDLVKQYQTYISAMVAAGASQSSINSALMDGASKVREYGTKLGLSESETRMFVDSLGDMNTLIRNIPPVTLATNLDPVSNALKLFFNEMSENAAKTSKKAGDALTGGSGGAGGSGGSLKQSMSELLDAQIKYERESYNSFSSYLASVTSLDDTSRAKIIDGLLQISSMTSLTSEQQTKAWEDSYSKINDAAGVSAQQMQDKMIQAATAVAEQNGMSADSTQGAWLATAQYMGDLYKSGSKNKDNFYSAFTDGMFSVYQNSGMTGDQIKNDWKARVDSYKGYLPTELYNQLVGETDNMAKAGSDNADAVKNSMLSAFTSSDFHNALASAFYDALNPNNMGGYDRGQQAAYTFRNGFVNWINGNPLNLSSMMGGTNPNTSIGVLKVHARGGQVKMHAGGGMIFGAGNGTADLVDSKNSPGEFIVRQNVARNYMHELGELNTTGHWPGGSTQVISGGSDPAMLTLLSRLVSYTRQNRNIILSSDAVSSSQNRLARRNGAGYVR